MSFELIEGVSLTPECLDGISSAYQLCDDGVGVIDSVLSAELIRPLLERGVGLLPEPHFFFLELPCTEEEEKKLRKSKTDPLHYNVYYLDGCTAPVSKALLDRYGELLINDGLVRFGFGSNLTDEEIYVLDYQQVRVCADDDRFQPLFDELGAVKTVKLKTVWENFSPEHAGISMSVEIEGETCADIPEILGPEGMYLAETREIGGR